MNEKIEKLIVVIGAGAIGLAIARRVGEGKHILLADLRREDAEAAAKVLGEAGFDVSIALVDVASRQSVGALVETATAIGSIHGLIHTAGVSPSQASPETIFRVDLYGTALVLELFGNVIAEGGAGIVIASQSGHRLPALTVKQNNTLATAPAEDLLAIALQELANVKDSLYAYQFSKRGNALRVMAEAVRWGKRGARINAISPGIIMTPLANDELSGPRGDVYRQMINHSAAGRAGTADEIANVAALLMGEEGTFITGSDFLVDGGVTAAYWFGELAPASIMTELAMEKPSTPAKSKPPYLLGLLCLVPLVGAFVGLGLLLYGIFKYKDKWLSLIGAFGILFTAAIYTIVFYLNFSDISKKGFSEISQIQLNGLIKNVEFYKLQYGQYPDRLQQLLADDKLASIYDAAQGLRAKGHSYYNYEKVGDKYTLFSSGPDGIPNTSDDLFPQVAITDSSKIGWIRPR